MMLLTRLLVILGLPSALFMIGCAQDAASIYSPGAENCYQASECPSSRRCIDFECVAQSNPALQVLSLEVSPPQDSGYTRTQFLDLDSVELTARGTYELPTPNQYETVIYSADGEAISANLAIFGTPRIAGRELDVNATLIANTGVAQTFRLNEGTYVVRIRPTSDALPGIEVNRFTVRSRAGPIVKEFVLPANYRRLYGKVTSSLSGSTPLAGVTVRAFGLKSGLPSTVSVTNDLGEYALLLPATEDTIFRLVATPPADQHPAWGFEQIVGGIDPEQGRQRVIHLEPTQDDVRGNARFQILGAASGARPTAPIANAFVTVTATTTGGVEPPTYSISGITDAAGFMLVEEAAVTTTLVPLLRAKYEVHIVPPASTPYATQTVLLDLTAAGPGFTLNEQIAVPQRTKVRGTLRTAAGQVIDNARLEVRPLSKTGRPADASSDGDGDFSIALDPGPYLVIVRPRGIRSDGELVPVSAHQISVPADSSYALPPLTAPPGQMIRAQVRGTGQNEVLTKTRVEFFFDVSQEVVSLGHSETDGQGWFTALVPAP